MDFSGIFRKYGKKGTNALKRAQLKGNLDKSEPEWKKKYEVATHTYPENLFDANKPLGAYVMFYINVFEGSKVFTDKNVQFVENNDEVQRQRKNGIAKKIANRTDEVAMKGAFTAAAMAGGGAIGGLLMSGESNFNLKAASYGTAAAIAGLAAIGSQGVSFTKSQKRLKQAIAMHMPNEIQIGYSTSYSSESMSDFALASKIGQSVVGAATGTVDLVKNAVKLSEPSGLPGQMMPSISLNTEALNKAATGIIDDVKSYGAPVAGAALKYLPYGNAVSAITGLADNPQTQVMFQGVTPRTFEMNYDLYAHSEEELENIHRIINTFKMNMLPEYKGEEQFLFVYPAEFDIEYYFGAEQNKYIHKHTSCVLTDCTVNYTPDGVFNHFNKNGAPLRIRMNLRFTELDILTRDDINAEGGGY